VSSCRIYKEDTKAHYKVMNERKGKSQQSRPKPYNARAGKGMQRLNDERRPRKKDTPAEIVCYTCGEKGHKSNACPGDGKRCFHCGKKGHTITECKHGDMVCSTMKRKVTLVRSARSLRRFRLVERCLL